MSYDPDEWRFRQYAEGNTKYPYDGDSPVDLSGREGYEPESVCRGYGSPDNGIVRCGREKDSTAEWCDVCADSAELDARQEAETRAWAEYNETMANRSQYQHLKGK